MFWRAVTRTCESPSRTTRSKPVSNAKLKALLAAIASTSMAVKGSMVLSVRETITWPSWFRRITPNPAHFSDSNNAPSKFNLYSGRSGGCQHVGGRPTGTMLDVLWGANSRILSLAWCSNWSREMTAFPSLWLFLRFHKAQITMEKRAGSLFSEKTQPVRSIKVAACQRLSWFHMGTLLHSSVSFGQW